MDQRVKEKWIAALRSGNYEQGRSALRSGNQYCCLGVLCDLFIKEQEAKALPIIGKLFTPKWRRDAFGIDRKIYEIYGTHTYIPVEIQKWAGLRTENPSIYTKIHERVTLAAMNDIGSSFDAIAELVDKNL